MLDILRATQHLATHIRYRPQKTNKLVIQNGTYIESVYLCNNEQKLKLQH